MRVLLLGGGGREHAIGWKLSSSETLTQLISCPGNPGLAAIGQTVSDVDPSDTTAVLGLARQRSVDLVIIGPEAPLAAGVADGLREGGIPAFGPGAAGAMLESSKSFANDVMEAAGIPTGKAVAFSERGAAYQYLEQATAPYVVKADGLAAGKGVLVSESLADARAWVDECVGGRFGPRDATVVIEEFLDGDEVSVFFLCAEGQAVPFEPARDYKRLHDQDRGPNTGGMGSFSPVEDLPPGLVEWTRLSVALPALAELASRGIAYTGFLYVGLMLTATGPKVVEFNVRLGDPETQALMPRLGSDLLTAIWAAVTDGLTGVTLDWLDVATVNVVLAASGYPDAPRKGDEIVFGSKLDSSKTAVFHAGTAMRGNSLVTSGGRVLSVVGIGDTVPEARSRAYEAAATISFTGKQSRTDIGA